MTDFNTPDPLTLVTPDLEGVPVNYQADPLDAGDDETNPTLETAPTLFDDLETGADE